MAGFRELRSKSVVLAQTNIDTDQIIPARFLSTTERAGRPMVRRTRRSPSTSPRTRAAASCWPDATSAAAPRASMPPGR